MNTYSTNEYTVMFADVVGSTKLYEELGDVAANSVISQVIDLMQDSTLDFSGIVIKTIGDEVMCRFSSTDNAAKAAIQIQEKLQLDIVQGIFVSVKIGFHSGSALLQADGDLFGDTVNTAARMASIAKGRQIILTKTSARQLSEPLMAKARDFDKVHVKGKSEEVSISELVWENSDVTRLISIDSLMAKLKQELILQCGDRELKFDTDGDGLQLGRKDECELVVRAELASRFHAKILVKRGKFVLVDQSTNGTYIVTEDGTRHYLRREELTLSGGGQISLGCRVSECKSSERVQYQIKVVAK